jgi:hypothetical protein
MFGMGIAELIIIITFLIIFWVVPGIIGALLAKNKGRNPVGWFFLSAFLWIPIFVVILLPPAREVPGKYRECPSCKEFVKWRATICKHCGKELPPVGLQ